MSSCRVCVCVCVCVRACEWVWLLSCVVCSRSCRSCELHRDIAQHCIVLLCILVSCTGTLHSALLYCCVFLWVAQGHCAALYCTVGYSCELHRDIAQYYIVLLGVLVSCTGTLHGTLLYCWVFLWDARSLSTFFTSVYAAEQHSNFEQK